jgi:Rab-GTPase-TBC domain
MAQVDAKPNPGGEQAGATVDGNGRSQHTNTKRRPNEGILLTASANGDGRAGGHTNTLEALSSGGTRTPVIQVNHESASRLSTSTSWRENRTWLSRKTSKRKADIPKVDSVFQGLTLDIPSGDLGVDIDEQNMQFSNRGSMFIDGRKFDSSQSLNSPNLMNGIAGRRVKSNQSLQVKRAEKVLSTDEESMSQKVRLYYESGTEHLHEFDGSSSIGRSASLRGPDALSGYDGTSTSSLSRETSTSDIHSHASDTIRHADGVSQVVIEREANELAGGLEDWQGIENEDVDRYGFIIPKNPPVSDLPTVSMKRSPSMREPVPLQRISTSLQLASETPRRKTALGRSPNSAKSPPVTTGPSSISRQPSKRSFLRPTSSQSAYPGHHTGHNSRLRHASNRFPHNSNRRLMDEAGDMLTLPPNLEDIAENSEVRGSVVALQRKERQREEKWRKMAKISSTDSHGGGMVFDFDVHDPTLIERTWKGIPDRWRATAWYAFLSASARKHKDSPVDKDLIEVFHECQSRSSPDDLQIDIDVPRTVSSHIMFRRRYRGGQRLLFRVLHAMSLYFPETGYVQGMAALVATLLAYYEEEKAFVMLVRLWELRGLNELYKSGFGGLMEALDDFEKRWLGEGELAKKLVRESITVQRARTH